MAGSSNGAHAGKKLVTSKIGARPQRVAISPNGRWGLAVSAVDGKVSVMDIGKQRLAEPIKADDIPHGHSLFALERARRC